jgi:hypothetical protein
VDTHSRNWKPWGLLAGGVALAVLVFIWRETAGDSPEPPPPWTTVRARQAVAPASEAPPEAPPRPAAAPARPSQGALAAGDTQPAPRDRPRTEHFIPPDPNDMPAYWRNEDPEDPPLDLTHRPTPRWRLAKTEEALGIVTERAERTEREAAEAERAGRAEEAARKREKAAMLRHKRVLIQADLEVIRGEVLREALAEGEQG